MYRGWNNIFIHTYLLTQVIIPESPNCLHFLMRAGCGIGLHTIHYGHPTLDLRTLCPAGLLNSSLLRIPSSSRPSLNLVLTALQTVSIYGWWLGYLQVEMVTMPLIVEQSAGNGALGHVDNGSRDSSRGPPVSGTYVPSPETLSTSVHYSIQVCQIKSPNTLSSCIYLPINIKVLC